MEESNFYFILFIYCYLKGKLQIFPTGGETVVTSVSSHSTAAVSSHSPAFFFFSPSFPSAFLGGTHITAAATTASC